MHFEKSSVLIGKKMMVVAAVVIKVGLLVMMMMVQVIVLFPRRLRPPWSVVCWRDRVRWKATSSSSPGLAKSSRRNVRVEESVSAIKISESVSGPTCTSLPIAWKSNACKTPVRYPMRFRAKRARLHAGGNERKVLGFWSQWWRRLGLDAAHLLAMEINCFALHRLRCATHHTCVMWGAFAAFTVGREVWIRVFSSEALARGRGMLVWEMEEHGDIFDGGRRCNCQLDYR
jgi:hypothetical protein